MACHVAVLVQAVGHYHAARFAAARKKLGSLAVLPMMAETDFPEFATTSERAAELRQPLYRDREAYRRAISDGSLARLLGETLDRLSPAVMVVSGWAEPESLAAISWARRNRRGVVVMSESQAEDGPRSRLREWIKGRVVGTCDAALVGGRTHQAYVSSLGVPAERIFLGYDAVDNAHFENGATLARKNSDTIRRELGLPRRYILASGRFVPKKNFPRLVEAFAKLVRERPDAPDLVILGDGAERPAIEAAAKSGGVEERVLLPGFRSYDMLPAFYGMAELFVHPSIAEQWGLVINEAAAAGLPLVVSNVCGAAYELVHEGRNGLLFDPTDVDGLAAALRTILDAPPAARAEKGAASRTIAADWDVGRFARGFSAAVVAAARNAALRGAPSAFDMAIVRAVGRRPRHVVA